MKKNILFFAVFLLVAVNALADQTLNSRQPREWENSTANKPLEGKDYQGDTTAYTNLVITGHQKAGNIGYVALVGSDGNSVSTTSTSSMFTYYLWVDNGKLMIASFPNVKNYSSFPYGDWRSVNGFKAGTVVGSQS